MESNQRFIVRRLFAAAGSSSSPIPGIIKSVSICWAVRYSSGPHHPPPPTFLIVCLSSFDWVRGWQGVTFESVPSSWHPRKARAYKSNETQSSQNHPKDKLLNGDWIPLVLYLLSVVVVVVVVDGGGWMMMMTVTKLMFHLLMACSKKTKTNRE